MKTFLEKLKNSVNDVLYKIIKATGSACKTRKATDYSIPKPRGKISLGRWLKRWHSVC
jgi:hypothetical protein